MEQKKKIILTFGILILLVAGFYLITKAITQYTGYAVENSEYNLEDFAKCLQNKNVKMYGAFWCGHCQNQKELFGDAIEYIYVECDPRGENAQTEECQAIGIDGYPTWRVNGINYAGEKSLEELARLSGCEL